MKSEPAVRGRRDAMCALESLSAELMRVFAPAFKLPMQFFDDKIQAHFSTCPSNCYPALNYVALPGQLPRFHV